MTSSLILHSIYRAWFQEALHSSRLYLIRSMIFFVFMKGCFVFIYMLFNCSQCNEGKRYLPGCKWRQLGILFFRHAAYHSCVFWKPTATWFLGHFCSFTVKKRVGGNQSRYFPKKLETNGWFPKLDSIKCMRSVGAYVPNAGLFWRIGIGGR